MEDLIKQLLGADLVTQIVLWVGVILGIANAVTASFPSVKENAIYNFVMKILNFLAMNIGKNKNHDAVKWKV